MSVTLPCAGPLRPPFLTSSLSAHHDPFMTKGKGLVQVLFAKRRKGTTAAPLQIEVPAFARGPRTRIGGLIFWCCLFAPCLAGADGLAAGLRAIKNGDFATALKEFRPLAENGDAVAQFHLGFLYASGSGVPQDYAEALRWYRSSADRGNASALARPAFTVRSATV